MLFLYFYLLTMNNIDLAYKKIKPQGDLHKFVESFMFLGNHADKNKEVILFPDGRIDVIFQRRNSGPTTVELFNLDKTAKEFVFESKSEYFIICFTLLGVEYLLSQYELSNHDKNELPKVIFDINDSNFVSFDSFVEVMTNQLSNLIPNEIEQRKIDLFTLIYNHKGEMSVHKLSEKTSWNSRQINRYFSKQFGISLKSYSTIIRFRASFNQIRNGQLYPLQNFADQAHFIKEIKKFSNFLPKELAKNENDRFLQFSILPDD